MKVLRAFFLVFTITGPAWGQTPLTDRPGMWVSAPAQSAAGTGAAGTGAAGVSITSSTGNEGLRATPPATLTAAPRRERVPDAVASAPQIEPSAPNGLADAPRPTPRPVGAAATPLTQAAPDIALESDVPVEVALAPTAPSGIDIDVSLIAPPLITPQSTPEPQMRPEPRPAALSQAASDISAGDLAAQALQTVRAVPVLPVASDAGPVLPPTPFATPATPPPDAPPSTARASRVPEVSVTLVVAPRPGEGAAPAAPQIRLPDPTPQAGAGAAANVIAQPVTVALPMPDLAPISGPRPPGPTAQITPSALRGAPTPTGRTVLPRSFPAPVRPRALVASMAPEIDRFPFSVLPPSALPRGPVSIAMIPQPVPRRPEPMAAALMPLPRAGEEARPAPTLPALPLRGEAPRDPEAPIVLPAPDPLAVARLVDEAAICWRRAWLGSDAAWTRVHVAVALDEMNHASAASVHLTGFSGGLSGAAEEAYRAAHTALIGCGAATQAEPATAPAVLVFDRDGVRRR